MHKTDPNAWKKDWGTRLVIRANGTPEFPGIDYSGKLTVHFRTNNKNTDYFNFIIVKVSGGTYWSGIATPAAYAGAKFVVLRIHQTSTKNNEETLLVERLVEFPVVAEADLKKRRDKKEETERAKYAALRKSIAGHGKLKL